MKIDTTESLFLDNFGDLSRTHGFRNVVQRRIFPRLLVQPDIRINPADPKYYRYKGKVCGYGWFPVILRLHSGTLLCAYNEASEHVWCPGGRAVVSRSTDGGRTWSGPIVIFNKKDYKDDITSICQTNDGCVWIGVSSTVYDCNKGLSDDPRAWKYLLTAVQSRDDGKTWQKTPVLAKAPPFLCPAIEMSNGQLLWIGAIVDERGEPRRATFLHSEEKGRFEWKSRIHPELGPTGDEWTVIETKHPGVLACMMRQQQHSQFYATAKSYDYGKTWTPWRESNVYMGPFPTRPMLRKTDDGTLLFTYGQRWIGRTFVVASHDDGETWDIAHRQVILHSPAEYYHFWDSHYTDIARAEGNIWIAVDYIASPKREEQKGVYGTFIDTAYFKDVYEGVTLACLGTMVTNETRGHWSFDEIEGGFVHDSVAGNYGEIHGAKRVPGRIGNALQFDGKNNYVMVYDDVTLRLPKYFTLEAWVNTPVPSKDQTLISKSPRYTLCLRGGKLSLEIGNNVLVAEMKKNLPKNQWVHVAVTFGMRQGYSRATFFINGREASWSQSAGRAKTFAEAMGHSDTQITGGGLFQEFGHKNTGTDNLVIGIDNDLKGRPFSGIIDEVAIHAGDLLPERIHQSYIRGYCSGGVVSSLPIVRPKGGTWQRFHARTTLPQGTKIMFQVEDPGGKVLKTNVADGTDIFDINVPRIVLRAELSTRLPGQTPILHQWSAGWEGNTPVVVSSRTPPNQTDAKTSKKKGVRLSKGKGGVVF